MKKCRRLLTAKQAGELNLAAGRIEQIVTAYDEVDALQPVIDDDRKLIRPVAMPIADEQITALFEGLLLLRPEPKVVEPLDAWNPASRGRRDPPTRADACCRQVPG